MSSDALHRINKELDSLSNPARQALNAITRTVLEQSTRSYFKVNRTRKYKSQNSGSVSLLFELNQTPTLILNSLDASTIDDFAGISVGDSVSGDGISENAIVTVKNSDSLIINVSSTISGISELTFSSTNADDEISAIRGSEEVELKLDRWMLKKLHIFFKEWAAFGYTGEAFDELIIKDNFIDDINTTFPFGKTPIMGQNINGSVKTYLQPATRSLVMLSKIIHGDFDNLRDYDRFSGQINYSINMGADGQTISIDNFESSDDLTLYTSNFANSDVAYWLHKIRNSQNNWIHAHSSPSPVNIKTPIFNKYLGVEDFDGNVPYKLPYNFYKNDQFGYYGDAIEREAGGYSWDVTTPHLSIGYKNQAAGDTSVAIGKKNIAAAQYSSAFNCSTQALSLRSASFGIDTIAGDMPYAFVNAAGDDKLEIEVNCNSECEEIITIAGQDMEIENLDLTISIDGNVNYSLGDKLLLYNALDEGGNKRKESLTAIIITEPSTVTKNDGSGLKTVIQLSFDSDTVGSFRSGWISKLSTGENLSTLVIGRRNNPNPDSIFQIGDESSSSIRTTSLEVGFNNGNYSERYFKFGNYTTTDVVFNSLSNLFVSPEQSLLSVGGYDRNFISITDNVSRIYSRDSGSIELYDSIGGTADTYSTNKSMLKIVGAAGNVFSEVTDSNITIKYPELISNMVGSYYGLYSTSVNIDMTNEEEVLIFADEPGIRLYGTDNTSLSSRFMTIQVGQLNVGQNTNLVINSDDATLEVEKELNINFNNRFDIDGGSFDIYTRTLKITNDSPISFPIDPSTGCSHNNRIASNQAPDADTTQSVPAPAISNQVPDPETGMPGISTAGFNTHNSSILYGNGFSQNIINDSYSTGTLRNLVPDTNLSNVINFSIMNYHKDEWKWLIARANTSNGRVWTTTKSDGRWDEWRAFTYYDDVEKYGTYSNYKYRPLKMSQSLTSNAKYFAKWNGAFPIIPPSNIVSNVSDSTADLSSVSSISPLTTQRVDDLYFNLTKIGNTIFFRLSIKVTGNFEKGLVAIVNGQYSEISPNSSGLFTENTQNPSTNETNFMLNINKFSIDGAHFLIHARGANINVNNRRIDFSGHYYCTNANKLR